MAVKELIKNLKRQVRIQEGFVLLTNQGFTAFSLNNSNPVIWANITDPDQMLYSVNVWKSQITLWCYSDKNSAAINNRVLDFVLPRI